MKKKKTGSLLLAVVVALVLILAGCRGPSDSTEIPGKGSTDPAGGIALSGQS